jgi:hypothetical protein
MSAIDLKGPRPQRASCLEYPEVHQMFPQLKICKVCIIKVYFKSLIKVESEIWGIYKGEYGRKVKDTQVFLC